MIIITNNDSNGIIIIIIIIIINKKTDKKCKQNEDLQVHEALTNDVIRTVKYEMSESRHRPMLPQWKSSLWK